jgi:hypothetical protein
VGVLAARPARTLGAVRNWLEELDARARDLPQARSWVNYPYFMFSRYPWLRPERPRADIRRQLTFKSNRKAYEATVHEWKRSIAQKENGIRILSKLDDGQTVQLAALVLDTVVKVEEYRTRLTWHKRVRKLASEEARRVRIVKRKLVKLHALLEELADPEARHLTDRKLNEARRELDRLHNYVNGLDPLLGVSKILGDVLPHPDSIESPDFALLLRSAEFHPIPVDPVTSCMVQLYWYFRHGCRLTGNESGVRVALVRNTFWTSFGVTTLPFNANYDKVSAESSGCAAVDAAVRRYSNR